MEETVKSIKSLPENIAETVDINSLKPHPRNYQEHPEDELEHIIESIQTNGVYRNIVVARDGTILAGHGVVKAARKMGLKEIPVVRLDVDPDDPKALKVLTGDNEIGHLAERDDRLLSELLKEIKENDPTALLGTGYDEMMLANLVMITRPESEIADFNEAAEWVGLPEYEPKEEPLKLTISFRNEQDREDFVEMFQIEILKKEAKTWMTWYPPKEKVDARSVRFEVDGEEVSEPEEGGDE
jgi:hypothetical protein